MDEIKVKFNKAWGYSFFVLGVLLLLTQLWLYSVTQKNTSLISIITAVFIIISGIRYLSSNYFMLTKNEIRLFNLFGSITRRYTFNNPEDLIIVDGKLFIEQDGTKSKQVRLSKIMAHKSDWNKFIREVSKNDYGKELHDK